MRNYNASAHFLSILLIIKLFRAFPASRSRPGNDKSDPFTAQAPKRPFLNTNTYSTRGNIESRR